jgi:probable F420-dependent oxidoreductase
MSTKLGIGLFTGQIPPSSAHTFHDEYQDILELVRAVEKNGLDAAWVSEHHFASDGYLPALLPMLGAMAAVTTRIELGTGVLLAPFHDPIRLAEDFAVVDQLAGGRTICGLAIGWRDEEFREFGVETSTRTRRLREIVDVLRLAWNEGRFDYEGRHYSYSGVNVTPKPARTPPILIGGFADSAVRRAGRIGDGFISSRVPTSRLVETFEMAAEARAQAGHESPPIVGVLQNAFVTEDPERDWPMVAAGIGHQLGVYSGWRSGTDVPGVPLAVEAPDESSIRTSTAYGTPEDVARQLGPLMRALAPYPEAHLVCRLHYPGMELEPAARAIELFGNEVAPRLGHDGASPAT